MNEQFENIDELFKDELKNYSSHVPHGVWENIEHLLPQKQNNKAWFTSYKIAASIALILATGSLGVYLFVSKPVPDIIQTSKTVFIEPAIQTPTIATEHQQKTTFQEASKNIKKSDINEGVKSHLASNTTETILIAEIEVPTITKTDNIVSEKVVLIDPIEAKSFSSNTTEDNIVFTQKALTTLTAYEELLAEFESIEEDKKRTARWMVGGQAGPQYSYRQLSSQYNAPEYLDSYNQIESGIIAYAGGVNIAYKPTRRLSVQSGVYYSKIGQTVPAQVISNRNDEYLFIIPGMNSDIINQETPPELRISTSLGEVPRPNATNNNTNTLNDNENNPEASVSLYEGVSHVNQYMEFLEIPLIARYAIIDRKINFHLLGGMSTNFLIASPVYLDNGDYYTDTKNINKVNYSSTVGLGLGYNFSSNLKLSIEPQFKYYINKVNSDSTTDVHPYSLGIFTGFSYLF